MIYGTSIELPEDQKRRAKYGLREGIKAGTMGLGTQKSGKEAMRVRRWVGLSPKPISKRGLPL